MSLATHVWSVLLVLDLITAMSPVELSPASQTASTSSTLWAQRTHILCAYNGHTTHSTTASKEWVIPAKPKPGRKPKESNTAASFPKDDLVRPPVSDPPL